jgi:TetR/AcrR family transcriptional regulator, regulator of mycofactocin system
MEANAQLTRGDRARLEAAERCAELYVARGTTDLTVAEITAAIGIAPRTFHRHFPTKAESIAPIFDWTTRQFNAAIVAAPTDATLREVARLAFTRSLGEQQLGRTRALFPLIFADPDMWAVFLRKLHDGETSLAPVLAPRLGVDPASLAARTAAAVIASATRIALETMVTTGDDAETVYLNALNAFTSETIRRL